MRPSPAEHASASTPASTPLTSSLAAPVPRTGGLPAWLVPLLAALVIALLPLILSGYTQDLVVRIMIYAILAMSLELLVGTTGLISLGHAAFYGVAAYVTVLASGGASPINLVLLLCLAIGAAGAYALVVGALSLRTKGVYFIMVTLAFAQMAFFIFHDTAIGGGSDGMFMTPRPSLTVGATPLIDLENGKHLYFFTFACLALTYAVLSMLLRSRFGHALAGIRINEQRMRAAGYATYWYKLAAFVTAAMLAGLAGFLMASHQGLVNPEFLSWHESGAILLMIILGGLGSLRGAVVGAVVFVLLRELFGSEAVFGPFAKHWQLTLGVSMILMVAFLPNGLIGVRQLFKRKKVAA